MPTSCERDCQDAVDVLRFYYVADEDFTDSTNFILDQIDSLNDDCRADPINQNCDCESVKWETVVVDYDPPFRPGEVYIEFHTYKCAPQGGVFNDRSCVTHDGKCCRCPSECVWDDDSDTCITEPCPDGKCWCESTGQCNDCVEPFCKDERNCVFDPTLCDWDCDPIPPCDPGYHWDASTCSCLECDPGTEWCDPSGRCIRVDPPDCYDELACFWDEDLCDYQCNAPNCPPGEVWDSITCQCITECPAGECWCEDPYTYVGSCIACTEPDCAEELNCYWDIYLCDWVCDDPEEICGAQNEWDYDLCRCAGDRSSLIRDTTDQFLLFHANADSEMVGDFFGPDDVRVETYDVDTDPSCHHPSFWLLEGVIMGCYLRGTSPKLAISRTHGRTYQVHDIPGEYATLSAVEHRGRIVVMGFRAGTWYQRVGKIGEDGLVATADWSDEVDSGIGSTWVPVLTPTGNGFLKEPTDNQLNFAWEATEADADGEFWHVNVCRVLSLAAIGDWN